MYYGAARRGMKAALGLILSHRGSSPPTSVSPWTHRASIVLIVTPEAFVQAMKLASATAVMPQYRMVAGSGRYEAQA